MDDHDPDEEGLSDYSDEEIPGIDIPDNILLDDFEFADNITSCNKVENCLMLSEYEQNLSKEKEWGPLMGSSSTLSSIVKIFSLTLSLVSFSLSVL